MKLEDAGVTVFKTNCGQDASMIRWQVTQGRYTIHYARIKVGNIEYLKREHATKINAMIDLYQTAFLACSQQ
jgi:hypothetical protein